MYLAVLDDDNIVKGIKQTKNKIDDSRHVEIDSYDVDLLFRKYDDGDFSDEKHEPETDDNEDESITKKELKEMIEEKDLNQSEAIASIYERLESGGDD